jgi:ribose/xylose/arabinose/galactoside ABC-type transport system permease subunit
MNKKAMEDKQSGGIRRMAAAYAEIVILVLLIVLFSILNPTTFPTVANFNTILNIAAVPTIIGVGATFVVLMGRIDLSVEGIMGAAGLAYVLLSPNSRTSADWGFGAIVVAIALGAGLGLAAALVHTRLKVPSFIVSLGMWYVGLGIAAVLFGQEMQPFLSDPNTPCGPHQPRLAFLTAISLRSASWPSGSWLSVSPVSAACPTRSATTRGWLCSRASRLRATASTPSPSLAHAVRLPA